MIYSGKPLVPFLREKLIHSALMRTRGWKGNTFGAKYSTGGKEDKRNPDKMVDG